MTTSADMQVLSPRTTDEVRSVMLDTIASGAPIRIAGAGTWISAGAPVTAARTLSLHDLSGIVEYVPGDLTITALAGTSLAELSHATAAHGQWLGLDPAGDRLGTIGATIATASAGPLAHAFGTPRDLVLGLTAVTGYGEEISPGGRVVKNVAGFDLVRLYTGAWGTLGPITQVTLRLRALPVHDVTLVTPVASSAHCATLLTALRAHTLSLLAAEWIDGHTAAALGVTGGDDAILIRIGGNDRFVRGQRVVLDGSAASQACDPAVWHALASLDAAAPAVFRLSGAVSELPERLSRIRTALASAGATCTLHASLGRGTIRVIVTHTTDGTQAAVQQLFAGEQRIVERLPSAWWHREPDPFDGGLSARIRRAFDPQLLCNRRAVPDA